MSPQQEFKTAHQLNTRLAKRLNAALQKRKTKKYEKPKDAQNTTSAGTSAPHVEANEMPKGVLSRDTGYAWRGPDYIEKNQDTGSDGRGGVYDQVTAAIRPEFKEIADVVSHAKFPDATCQENFNKKYEQKYPYAWQAHHMLPPSAFYYDGGSGPCFTYRQLAIILRSDYNVNDGHNMILLPGDNWAVPVHRVPQHPSDHVRYTQRVMTDLKDLSQQLQKLIDEAKNNKEHLDAVAKRVYDDLRALENDYWRFLVKLGRAMVEAVLAGTKFLDKNASYAEISGEYKWGRLI